MVKDLVHLLGFVIILFTSELPYFVHTTSCNLERNLHVTLMVGFCFAQTTFNMKNGFLITNSCYCAYGNDSSNTIHKSCSVPTNQLKNMQHFSPTTEKFWQKIPCIRYVSTSIIIRFLNDPNTRIGISFSRVKRNYDQNFSKEGQTETWKKIH